MAASEGDMMTAEIEIVARQLPFVAQALGEELVVPEVAELCDEEGLP